jgi:uncharacterized protein
MKRTFADTSLYVALANPADALHTEAGQVADTVHGEVVTTDFVLVEAGNYFARSHNRPLFLNLMATLRADPRTRIVPANRALWERGLELFASRSDKDWSMTDCISFVVMRDEGITDALTSDHHFRQAGFTCLLTVGG